MAKAVKKIRLHDLRPYTGDIGEGVLLFSKDEKDYKLPVREIIADIDTVRNAVAEAQTAATQSQEAATQATQAKNLAETAKQQTDTVAATVAQQAQSVTEKATEVGTKHTEVLAAKTAVDTQVVSVNEKAQAVAASEANVTQAATTVTKKAETVATQAGQVEQSLTAVNEAVASVESSKASVEATATQVTTDKETAENAATRSEAAAKRAEEIAAKGNVDATTSSKGIVKLNNTLTSDSVTEAATPSTVKQLNDDLQLKANRHSPTFTGVVKAPTPASDSNDTSVSTTAWVRQAIAELVDSSPETLDTLSEIAAALGNDPNFATTMTNQLAGKQPLSPLLTAIAAVTTAANKLPYFTGSNQVGLADFTSTARDLLAKGSTADIINFLGLKTTVDKANGALQKNSNGADIPDKETFARNIGLSPDTYLRFRGEMPVDADINTFAPDANYTGTWSKSTSTNASMAKHFPEDGAVGYLEVYKAGNYSGAQRFTCRNGNVYNRMLSAAWNGTNGPWSPWRMVTTGVRPLSTSIDLNSLGGAEHMGNWRNSSSSLAVFGRHYPEEGSEAQGVLEVMEGGLYGRLQRYTTRRGTMYVRGLTATWDSSNPQWEDWIQVGYQVNGAYYKGSFNDLTKPGRFSVTGEATDGPLTDSAGATLLGVCEVTLRLDGSGVEQNYTTYGTGAETKGRKFQRIRTGNVWSEWREIFTSYSLPLALGIGGVAAKVDPLDWQTFDFVPGQMISTPLNTMKNIPAGMDWGVIDGNLVNILVGPSDDTGTGRSMLVWRSTVSTANYRFFAVRVVGEKGSRTITPRQMPVLNAAHTWAEKQTFAKGLAGELTGNASTATKLKTARRIGGVAFDGSGDVNLPGVNQQGNQNTTGNAATATKLQTARNINGVRFDGSADININTLVGRGRVTALTGSNKGTPGIQMYEVYNNGYPTTYGNLLHLGGATALGEGELLIGWSGTSGAHAPVFIRSRRDTADAPWSDWAQVYTARDRIPGVNTTGNQDTTGNAATATKLKTARRIGGVSFDGTGDINLPGVNTAGNQSTTGNAATATKLQTARTINGVKFDGSADITLTPANLDVYSKSEIDNKKGMRKYTFSAPANAVSGKWYPIVFRRSGGSTDELASRVVITTYSSAGGYAMNNCEFNGFVMPGGWSDRGSYAAGFFSIYSTAERAIHSIISSVKDDDLCSVFYVEARAFPIKIFAEEGLNVIVPTADYAVGQTTYKWGATDPLSESTNAQIILDFKNGRGYYCSHPFISSLSGNAATATKLQTARNIGGVAFDGTKDISLPGVNQTGNQSTTGNAATATKLQTARTINGVAFDGTKNIEITAESLNLGQTVELAGGSLQKKQNGADIPDKRKFLRNVGAANTTTVSFNGGAGWFKLATVTMPQASSVVYISLIGGAGFNVGSPHQAGISELVLRAGNGNPKGITGALWRLTSVGFTNFAWVNTSGDTYDIYVEIGNYATGVNIQWDYTSNANVTIHTSPSYTANKPAGLTDGTVYLIYSTHNKPNAGDIGALPSGGGTIGGDLTVNGKLVTKYPDFRIAYGNYGFILRNDGSNTYFLLTDAGQAATGSWNGLRPLYFNNANGQVTFGHNVTGSGNGSFNDVQIRSDRRNKRNLVKLDKALDRLELLTGYLYEIQHPDDGWQTSVGLIAQDALEALPELVSEDDDVISGEKRLRLNYNGVIALLVEGMKSIRRELKELKEK